MGAYSLAHILFAPVQRKATRALCIQSEVLKFSKLGQMLRKFPEKVPRKFENCRISEKRTIQPQIPEIPGGESNGTQIPGKKFSKTSVYLAGLPSFP